MGTPGVPATRAGSGGLTADTSAQGVLEAVFTKHDPHRRGRGGELPARVLGLVCVWAARHEAELLEDWARARAQLPLVSIDPLD